MGDVSLGSIKAKLEVDASGVDKAVQEAGAALTRLGASSTQTAAYLSALMEVPEKHRGAFIGALLAQAEAVQRLGQVSVDAATRTDALDRHMNSLQATATKMNAAFDQQAARTAAAAVQMEKLHSGALKLNSALDQKSILAAASQMDKLHTEALKVDKGFDQAAKGLASFSSGFSDAIKQGLLFGGAAAAGAMAAKMLLNGIRDLAGGFGDLVQRGSEVTKIGSSFDALATSIGQSSQELLAAARVGSKGLIDDYALMAAANKGMMLGLPITAKEMGTLTTAATALGRAMGQDAKKSLDDLIIGLGRGSPKILDNIGIVVKAKDAYEEYAKAHQTTVGAMSQAEKTVAVYNAALVNAELRVKSLGETTLTTAEQIQQFNVVWSNFYDEVAVGVQAALGDVLKGLFQTDEQLKATAETVKFVVEIFLNGFVNLARIVGESMNAATSIFIAKVEEIKGAAGILRDALTFKISPTEAIASLNAIGKVSAKVQTDVMKGLGEALSPQSLTWKPYMKIPKASGAGARPGPETGEGGDSVTKDAEAAAKKLQAEMDRLSGAKAQAEVDLVTQAFVGLQKSGQGAGVDLAALGKQMVDLAQKGAKIPDVMLPAIQAFAQTAAMKDVPQLAKKAWDEMTKDAEGNIAKQSALKIKAWKEDEKAAKANADAITAIGQSQTDILQRQLQDGTLSVRQEFAIRRDLIVAETQEAINQLQQRRDAATDPAIVAALNEEIAKWRELADAETEALEEALRYAEISDAFGKLGAILGGVSDLFDAIGISADSAVGKIVSGMQVAVASVQNFAAQTTTAGKIGAGLSAAANIYKTGQEKGAVAGAISGAATGAMIGTMIAPGIGTVIGGAAGLIIGIAGGLRKPEYKKIMADVGKSWGVSISEGLGKEIEQIAKANKISRSLAELMSVSKIMGESGKDPREFTGKINDLMSAIKSGAVPAKEGLAELGKAFTMVADAAVAAGTVGDKAMVGLIKRARELGQVTPEMKAFVGAQLDSALAGIQKYVGAIEKLKDSASTTPEKFAAIGKTSGVVFGAMFDAMVSERGIVGAVDAMKDSYNTLHETLMSTLGPEAVSAILGPFGGAFATLQDETLRPIFEGIDGITQAMTGLANAGYLSTDQFGAMQDATAQLFDEAVAGGADMRTALLAVAPGIQAAISAAEQFGIPLDADMARLKALAEQNGITFATDPQAAMLDVLVSIAQVLGAEVPASARRASDAMRDLANSVPSNLDVNVNVNRNYRDNYGGEVPEPAPYPEFQHGSGGVRDFGPGTNVTLHGKEAVVTEKQMTTMGAAPVSITMSPTFTGDPLLSNEGRKDLSQFQVEEFVRQVRNSPYIQQILRDRGLR